MRVARGLLLLGALLGLVACAPGAGPDAVPRPALDAPMPERLSELGVLARGDGELVALEGVAYGLGHPLFSDYARKYRTVHLPEGAAASAEGGDESTLVFPVGTYITKTFYYPADGERVRLGTPATFAGPDAPLATGGMRLIETRVLRHTATGWDAVSYVWAPSGEDAFKARAGDLLVLETAAGETFDYLVPDANQCGGCHATDHGGGVVTPIGPKPGNLAAVELADGDQYALWRARGLVDGPEATAWAHDGAGAARAYLDANCAHCHSAVGAADTAGLDLGYAAPVADLGLCKAPVAAGRGSGGRAYDIQPGAPDESILIYRMDHTDPGIMMPELGRSLVHREGVALVRAWIGAMEGDCDVGSLL